MNKNTKKSNTWLMQFLISVLGTAIGVGLTFAVSNWMENRKKEQAQRLTAMMVIHDIDETIEQLKKMKEDAEMGYNATLFTLEHLDQMDSVPADTLYKTVNYILQDGQNFRFDMSKEKIFHSSPDTWQNLGSMKFIDNVQSFYFDRQMFQDLRNTSNLWREPVPMNEFEKLQVKYQNMSVDQYMEQYHSLLRVFLKEQLSNDQVTYYNTYSAWRISQLVTMIEEWTRMNNENKFLMSITDEELENYVNSMNQNGIALTEKRLIGSWIASSTDENTAEWEIRKDHTYSFTSTTSSAVSLPFSRGKITILISENGDWSIEGDSLIQVIDIESIETKLDVSKLVALPGDEDLLEKWIQENRAYLTEYYRNTLIDNKRSARHARLDASHDKLELKGTTVNENGEKEPVTIYLKRKK